MQGREGIEFVANKIIEEQKSVWKTPAAAEHKIIYVHVIINITMYNHAIVHFCSHVIIQRRKGYNFFLIS